MNLSSLLVKVKDAYSSGQWGKLLLYLEQLDLDALRDPELWFFLARSHQALQAPELGLIAWSKAIELDPNSVGLRVSAASACMELAEWLSAKQLIAPLVMSHENAHLDDAWLLILWARCLAKTGQMLEAEEMLIRQHNQNSAYSVALCVAFAEVNLESGDLERARQCLSKLKSLAGESIEFVNLYLEVLSASGESIDFAQLDQWLYSLDWPRLSLLKAAQLCSQRLMLAQARFYFQKAITLYGISGCLAAFCFRFWVDGGHVDELIHGLEVAIQPYPPVNPDLLVAECWMNAGDLSNSSKKLVCIDVVSAESLLLNAKLARLQGDKNRTLLFLRQWLELQPSSLDAQFALASELLAQGYWGEAWPLYESRFDVARSNSIVPAGISPRNSAIPPHGRNVLVFAEQGIGDSLMMASMLLDLQDVAGHLSLMVQPRLAPLLQSSFPGLCIISSLGLDEYLAFDSCYGIGSLGRFFRSEPSQCPGKSYIKPSDSAFQEACSWLKSCADPDMPRIGIAWRGGGQTVAASRRSLHLQQLLPILCHQQAAFVCLQYGDIVSELEEFESSSGVKIHVLDGVGDDLDLTAALTQQLDLVITVQQTALHISGSVGTPAWVLIPVAPEWRYGYSSSSMAWYDCVRLFRQASLNDWNEPIEALTRCFREFLLARSRHNGVSL